ncbi:tyrosinase family oxidase copper chaperone [Streptomyces sp. NPDC093109]|uniref:tyrosinase family oxidase copper chaperone n=1 Tax=Streptomyces sp. NPDC093109 TaxID=3154977 RepID=UPI00344B5075
MTDGIQTRPEGRAAGGAGPSRRDRTRRRFLRALFTLGVVTGTSAALAPILRAGRSGNGDGGGGVDGDGDGDGDGAGPVLDEMYRGRHIRIRAGAPAPAAVPAGSASGPASAPVSEPLPDIRIDGRPLHLMRRADGSYLSAVNHYEPFPTPIEAARAAVDDLRGAQLAGTGPVHHL